MRKFKSTPDGYNEAVKFLKSINKWEEVSKGGFSTDGWSIVETANDLYSKMQK